MSGIITVLKIGGQDLFKSPHIYDDIKHLVDEMEHIIVVAGGSLAIEMEFQRQNKEVVWLTLANGDKARFCGLAEMAVIESAYRSIVFPHLCKNISERGMSCIALIGADGYMVTGKRYRSLKIVVGEKIRLEKNSRVGEITSVVSDTIKGLLKSFSVVVISPPILGEDGALLNVDADMLAAHVAVSLNASYCHFLTSTNGILKEVNDTNSTLNDVSVDSDSSHDFVQGRMKQKLRAALFTASKGSAFVTISSSKIERPVTGMINKATTHVWKLKADKHIRQLYCKMVQIPSASGHERRLASYLANELKKKSFTVEIDQVGNLVARIGRGEKKLMLLGHLDTVPGYIPLAIEGDCIRGKGCVDAKGPLAVFIESASNFGNSDKIEIIIVGTVGEESATAHGGIYIRDHHSADAVIIGEPSNTTGIILGYNGLLKITITSKIPSAHSASRDYVSAADRVSTVVHDLRACLDGIGIKSVSLRKINSWYEDYNECSEAILNIRLRPGCNLYSLQKYLDEYRKGHPDVEITILRSSPGALNKKTSVVANSLCRAIRQNGRRPIFVSKSGTSDMNTLAVTWASPMVAYGPGDGALDHTPNEHLFFSEFDASCQILTCAIDLWAKADEVEI